MSIYPDASVLVALFIDEPFTSRADAILRAHSPVLLVSDFAAAELASAIARRVRTGHIGADRAQDVFTKFDYWTARETQRVHTTSADIAAAAVFIRRLDLTLRTPDAINIAIAQRVGADLVTFDKQMATSARTLGTEVVPF